MAAFIALQPISTRDAVMGGKPPQLVGGNELFGIRPCLPCEKVPPFFFFARNAE